MTLIASWAALDTKRHKNEVSAMYIMSDSRLSWGTEDSWDYGRKLFNFSNHPDILGYCGDVLFPTQVISQIITLGDAGLLFNLTDLFIKKSEIIFDKIISLLNEYPQSKMLPSFTIIHCGKTVKGSFGCRNLVWHKDKGWEIHAKTHNDFSDKLIVAGTGASEFNKLYYDRFLSYERKNSRDIYQCFIDTLENIKDKQCGGQPQLAGIYRGDISKTFGIILNNKRYVLGIEIPDNSNFGNVEWRNELFERCSPITKEVLPNAQRQPKVR